VEEEDEERAKSDDVEEDETYEQPPEPPRRHGKGPSREKIHYKPHPKRATKPPMSTKAVLLLAFLLNTSKE
jgi:hypothetical protein